MKTLFHRSSRRGFALLLTLIIVSFAAAIAVLFLVSARQERTGTDSYAQGSRVRQLADTAVNIVMGQINNATREGTAATPISWASQPGMIRTYNNTGHLSNAYKLYSWNNMVESTSSTPAFDPYAAAELPPAGWSANTALYTDLNAPVQSSNGTNKVWVYPIVDPNIANTSSTVGTATTSNNSAGITWDFPNEISYGTTTTTPTNYPGAGTDPSANPLPMPVQWCYILQDGTWTFPDASSTTKATFTGNNPPTATNPIVGRIAFWTDDETCKVNLNTAGEGAYWDWPKAASQDEMQFAGNPPVKGEFYRISGHPGSTSLSAIFPEVMGGTGAFSRWDLSGSFGIINAKYATGIGAILGTNNNPGLSPRLAYVGATNLSGSQAGTYPAPYKQTYNPTSTGGGAGSFLNGPYVGVNTYSPVVLYSYPLYATPDELFFDPPTPTSARTSENPALVQASNSNLTASFTPYQLSQRFFLTTTNSRAPETTLFNTPRVSMWPITWPYPSSYNVLLASPAATARGNNGPPSLAALSTSHVNSPDTDTLANLEAYTYQWTGAGPILNFITPQEELLAYCSTLNNSSTIPSPSLYSPLPYYFQRQCADIPSGPNSDWNNIQRNRYLANYLRGMIYQNEPGFGSSLQNQWGAANADWITLNCMDYCRSMINQVTFNPNATAGTGNIMYSYTGFGAAYGYGNVIDRNAYTVAPLRITPTTASGLSTNYFSSAGPGNSSVVGGAYVTQGSYPSLKEAAIAFIATARNAPAYMTPTQSLMTGTTPTKYVADPFYWRNLINFGPPYGPPAPGGTTIPALAAGALPDGLSSGTGAGISGTMESSAISTGTVTGVYPVSTQTTQMQAIMLFNFAQLRDGINNCPLPDFWIRVDGGSNLTASNVSNGQLFANAMSVEYYGRYGYGSTSPVFDCLRYSRAAPNQAGKTFDSTVISGGLTNWSLCSPQLTISYTPGVPGPLNFQFNGQKVIVSIYAAYPQDGTHTPDTDPTGVGGGTQDFNQFVTSYSVDFSKCNGTYAIPIAPRWNQRQTGQVWYPSPNQTGTLASWSWDLTEMVPDVTPVSNFNWTGASTPPHDITAANVRDANGAGSGIASYANPYSTGTTTCLDSPNNNNGNWMMYALVYNTANPGQNTNPNATFTAGAVATGTTLSTGTSGFSLSMQNRVNANVSGASMISTGEGVAIWSGTAATGNVPGALFTNTGFVAGGQAPQSYAPQGITEITPYDTVISMIVDPANNGGSTNGGDPRLTNNSGEQLTFSSSQALLAGVDASGAPAAVLNNTSGGVAAGVNSFGGSSPKTSYNNFPRATFEQQFHQLGNPASTPMMTGYQLFPVWSKNGATSRGSSYLGLTGSATGTATLGQPQNLYSMVGLDTNAYMQLSPDWDWTSAPGNAFDGGYIERPDQDYQTFYEAATYGNGLGTPYFSRSGIGLYSASSNTNTSGNGSVVSMFIPNRQVPSPIILGTLPSSMTTGWQTLAFNPNPASLMDGGTHTGVATLATPGSTAAGASNPPYSGSVTAPDHLLLDLFWMPVAEPYPISEEFSTAGKINLNYSMMPFPYIQRKSGLDAVLKSVWIYAIPDSGFTPQDYKSWFFMSSYASGSKAGQSATHTRYPINVDQTLKAFDAKFQGGDIFRSASQLCDMFLYPNDPTTPNLPLATWSSNNSGITTWWGAGGSGRLTSDNGRKAPYNAIYSRVTTQSNTYTVHWRVQALHKNTANGSNPATWIDGFDRVVSELRGATLIERYLDPNAGSTATSSSQGNGIPDYANPSVGPSASPITYYYKWRVENETYFQPAP